MSGTEHRGKKASAIEMVDGKVNNKYVSVLRDAGSSTVFVHRKHVEPAKFTGEVRMISLADGTVREVWIDIVTPYITGTVLALVLESPFADLIVENLVNTSIPKPVENQLAIQNSNELTFSNYLGEESTDLTACPCSAVQTRKQRAKELKEVEKDQASEKAYINDTPVSETVEISNPENTFSFCRRQDLIEVQKKDSSLDKAGSLVINEPSGDFSSCFVFRTNILYRLFKTNLGEVISQIVVPNSMRKTVLSLGHDVLLAGHLGTKKTRDRIMRHFFWPGILSDISEYCRSCPECQKGIQKAPLISIPPIEEPFQKIAIDFVGPLPLTNNRNRYILVCIDYATRYPEAIPLKNQEAETVADALISIFSRVGVPKELLTDQGSNFMSDLTKQVCKLFKINKLCTTPYHPEASGLVENCNGVLKKMLKSYAQKEPSTIKLGQIYSVHPLRLQRSSKRDNRFFSV